MSDTPRTDALIKAAGDDRSPRKYVPLLLDLTSTLERENADLTAALRAAWESGFALCRAYGDNAAHFQGEQKERQWREWILKHGFEATKEPA